MERFGEKLRILREKRRLSLRQLASELGFSAHGHIAQIERGERKPSADLIVKIARFFEITTDQLMLDEFELD